MIKPAGIYRRLFCRNGHGVHSPFVYEFITKVIEEKGGYYFFHDIGFVRLQLLQNNENIHYQGQTMVVSKAIQKFGISKKEGECLFRLAHYLKPHKILSIGSSMGLTPLYLAKYDSAVECIVLEEEHDFAEIGSQYLKKYANPSINIQHGNIHEQLPKAIAKLNQIECLYISKEVSPESMEYIIEQCLPHMKNESVCIISGIRTKTAKRHFWNQLCKHPKITVSIDLYKTGILFLNPRLHRKTYKTKVI